MVSGTFQALSFSSWKLGNHPRNLVLHQPPHSISNQFLPIMPPSVIPSPDRHCFNLVFFIPCPSCYYRDHFTGLPSPPQPCTPLLHPSLWMLLLYAIVQILQHVRIFMILVCSYIISIMFVTHKFTLPTSSYS